MEKSITKILDVSWRFGVTAATEYDNDVQKSFLQLQLRLENGGKIKNIFTEMTIAQFYKLLLDLQTAKSDLKLLS